LGTDVATLGVIVFLVYRALPQLTRVTQSWVVIASNGASLEAVDRLIARAKAAPPLPSGSAMPAPLRHGLTAENLSYRYGPTLPRAVDGVSFEVAAGTMVGIVGRSGAGKSTLVDLLARFHDPESGRVLYDGADVRSFATQAYRRRIAMVTQDPLMLDDTIRANIEFGLDAPLSPEALADVLERAHCAGFVGQLPLGVQTVVGERGVRVSGGQRQRIAFARALAQNPDILLLDEPTSALDSESETAIQKTLETLHGHATILVVAHRLATIRRCDEILVIDEGRLVERGKHEDLLARGGVYERLFHMQATL
jgi:ATP-binding cassette subfamily B protein